MKFSNSTSIVHHICHFISLFSALCSIIFFFFVCNSNAQDLSKLSYAELETNIMSHYQNNALDQVVFYAEFVVNKAKNEFGEADSTFAKYAYFLGSIYRNIGNYKKAEPFLVQSKNVFAKILGPESSEYTEALNALSNLYSLTGNLAKAEEMALESNDNYIKIHGKESLLYARGLYNLAMIYVEQGKMDEALANLILQEEIIKKLYEKKSVEILFYVYASMDLADIYQNMGQYEQAIPLYLQAQQLFLQNKDNQAYYAVILANLASAYQAKGKNAEAESLFLEAITVRAKLGKQESEYSILINNLALFYIQTNRYPEAEKLLLEALELSLHLFGKEHRSTLRAFEGLGDLYYKTKDYKKAEEYFIQAGNISDKVYGRKHITYYRYLNVMALVHYKMDNHLQSWDYVRQLIYYITDLSLKSPIQESWVDSLRNSETTNYINFSNIITGLEVLYFLLDKEQKKQEQYLIADLGLYLINQHRDKLTGSEDKLRLLEISNKWMQLSLKILDPERQKNTAFDIAEQNKSVLLLQATKTEKAYQLGELPDSLIVLDKNLTKERDRLEANLLENRPKKEKDSLRTVLVEINQNIENFKIMIGTKYPKYAKLKYQQTNAKIEEIQGVLDDKTALLEYAMGDSMVYIFYIDKNSFKFIQKKLDINDLNAKIKNFHRVLSHYKFITTEKETAYREYTENAQWFYENLIAPALPNQHKINKLIIVSDGELGHLPFEAFLVESAPQKETDYHQLHYLINDYKISYNYSATLFATSHKTTEKQKNNGQLLAMATNYDIKLEQNKLDWRLPTYKHLRTKLNALPAARKEVETLAETFNGFFGLDKEASEKVFKEKAGDYAVIHLAMHGLLDHKSPILSSLAFTEDGDSLENNFLHAYEISKMKLNADLVVLSACETGYGRFEKGNGIASLAQAFAYAGAPAMIVSLWQVNDYATSEIMKKLYQHLADGMEKDEALQQAKLQYMKNAKGVLAHPAFWSPFVLMGNTDSITLGRTHVFAPTWIIGIGAALLGGIAFAIRKRRKKE